MAREQGIVVKLARNDKPFGFIRRPDGSELFFHFSKYPRGPKPAVGDELEYEVQTDPSKEAGKQDFAAAITLVKKCSVSAPAPAHTQAITPLKGVFVFCQPTDGDWIDPTQPGEKIPVWRIRVDLVLTRGGSPVAEIPVTMKCGEEEVSFPFKEPKSTASGRVTFISVVAKDAVVLYYEAKATVGTTEYSFSDYCDPTDPTLPDPKMVPLTDSPCNTPVVAALVAPPKTAAQEVVATPVGFQRGSNAYYYRVQTFSQVGVRTSGVADTIIVVSSLNLEIGFALAPDDNFTVAPTGEVTTSPKGLAVIGVRLVGSRGQRGNIQFALKDNPDIHTLDLLVKTPLPAAS